MPVCKLNYGNNFYLIKIPKTLKDLFNDASYIKSTGEELEKMGVQPYNLNPSQPLIEAELAQNANGNAAVYLRSTVYEPSAPPSGAPDNDLSSPPSKRTMTVTPVKSVTDLQKMMTPRSLYQENRPGTSKSAKNVEQHDEEFGCTKLEDVDDIHETSTNELVTTPVKTKNNLTASLENWSPFKDQDCKLGCSPLIFEEPSPDPDEGSRFLKIEGLPDTPHFEEVFDFELEDCVRMAFPEHFIKKISHSRNKALVEVDSPQAARDICNMFFKFEGKPVQISIHDGSSFTAPPPQQMTSEVCLSGMPSPHFENYFTHQLNKHISCFPEMAWEQKEYNCNTSSLLIEFKTPEIASQFCEHLKLNPFQYRNLTIRCDQVTRPKDGCIKVLIEKVLPPFSKSTLMKGLLQALGSSSVVLNIGDYDPASMSVVIEMDSPDAQYELTSMGFIWYNYEKIYISPLPSDSLPPSKPNKEVWQVLLGDLVPPFCEITLKKGLLKALEETLGISSYEDPILRIHEYDPTNQSVVVDVESEDIAQGLYTLKDFQFNYDLVKFSKCPRGGQTRDNSIELSDPPLHSETHQKSAPKLYRTDWPYHESAQLMKLCIKHREILKNCRHPNYKATWISMQKDLESRNLLYTVTTMKTRFKGILKYYPLRGAQWPLTGFVEEYYGHIAEGTTTLPVAQNKASSSSRNLESSSTVEKRNIFHGIHVLEGFNNPHAEIPDMSYEKDLMLIAQYKTEQPRFEDTRVKSSTIYGDISKHMMRNNHSDMTAVKCSDRMGQLSDQFKIRYDKVRKNETGIGDKPMNWPYYDEMGKLFEGSAVLEPVKLFSYGTSYAITNRSAADSAAARSRTAEAHGRKRKQSNESSKKSVTPPSASTQQVRQGILHQFERFNNLLESDLNSKK